MRKILLWTAMGVLGTVGVFAQSQQTGTTEVGQRRENQKDRIANGVQDGQLTSHETANLESKDARINQQIKADRTANGGSLTGAEKAQINREQNRVSSQIYNDKHNAATQKFTNTEAGARRENQQDRIAQGIRSGSLTPKETANLERQQNGIARQVAKDRAGNGGALTGAQKVQVNRRLNRASNRIARKKHN